MNSLVPTPYETLWSDPALQSRIDEGIRSHRQSDATIRICDYLGHPLPGVKVAVEQHDSPFHFGSNIFKLGDYACEELNRAYESAFCSLFNGATVPFYWRTLEPEQGRPRYGVHSVPIARRPPPDRVVSFCKKHGLRMHGHTLVWSSRAYSAPDWLPASPSEAAPLWEKRIREIAARYGHDIPGWDVLNEAIAFSGNRVDGARMIDGYEEQSFAWAEHYLPPHARLDINEVTGHSWNPDSLSYTRLIERLLAAGRRIGAIGLQFHSFTDDSLRQILSGERHPPALLLRMLDHYGRFHLPLHVSEITLTSLGNSPGGLEAQAAIARNFYRLFFSHPSVAGITWWNLPDGSAAPKENTVRSGLLFDDMRPKPAYTALQNLIRHEWRTRAEGVTSADGTFRFRGFHGSYSIRTESPNVDFGIPSAITLLPGQDASQTIHLM